MTLEAFRAMYDDFGETKRIELNILDKQPTNPQAEVLLLDGVSRDAILGVVVDREDLQLRLEAAHPGLAVRVMPGFFSARSDYLHWKKVTV